MKKLLFLIFPCFLLNAQAPTIDWQKSYGGSSSDGARSVHQTTDGGFMIVGITFSEDGDVNSNNGEGDYWVIKQMHQDLSSGKKILVEVSQIYLNLVNSHLMEE